MSHTRIGSWVAVIIVSAFAMLSGCAKDVGRPMNEAPAVKPPACSALVLPAPNVAIPFGQSQFVTKWTVLGPFTFGENDFGGDPQTAAVDKEFMPDEGALDGTQKPPAASKAAWKVNEFKDAATAGMIDLDTFYNQIEHAAVYAVAWVVATEDVNDAKLLVGSDDYIKVWINGKLVHKYDTARRAGEPDQDLASGIKLNKGMNRIVVKCVDVVLDWNFYLRFTTKDSKAIGVKPE